MIQLRIENDPFAGTTSGFFSDRWKVPAQIISFVNKTKQQEFGACLSSA